MKTLLAVLSFAALGWIAYTVQSGAQSLEKGAAILAATPVASPAARAMPAPPATAPAPGKVWTFVPSLGRYVEHDPSVSASTSAGLNAYRGLPTATPTNPLNQRPSHR